jgi:hypothetical protein
MSEKLPPNHGEMNCCVLNITGWMSYEFSVNMKYSKHFCMPLFGKKRPHVVFPEIRNRFNAVLIWVGSAVPRLIYTYIGKGEVVLVLN